MTEFLMLSLVALLMIISPGPDFAIVLKNSLTRGRSSGIATATGVAVANLCHVTINLLGIGLIIAKSVVIFTLMKILGASYLIFLGYKSLRAKPTLPLSSVVAGSSSSPLSSVSSSPSISMDLPSLAASPKATEPETPDPSQDPLPKSWQSPRHQGFYNGFFTCMSNPKACLFFLSFFSVILSPATGIFVQIFYGMWISALALLWFVLVAVFFTHPLIDQKAQAIKHWLERITGCVLILFGLKLLYSEVSQ